MQLSPPPSIPAAVPRASSQRLNHLDGLRGWAALFVVFHHLLLTFAPAFDDRTSPAAPLFAPFSFLTDGPLAVGIFFVLSGIVLAVAVDAAVDRAPGWHGRAGFAGLVVKRWLRLALPILAAGLVVLALFGLGLDLNAPLGWSVDSGWMRDFFPAGYRPDLWSVLREATLGAFIGPQTPLHDPVLWTIRIEFPGSLLVFALKLLVPRGRPAALAAFALAAALLVQPFWIFNYCALFAIGVGFREIARSESRAAWLPRWHEPLGLSLILAGAVLFPVLDVDTGGTLQHLSETDASGLHLMPGMLRATLVVAGVMLSPGIQRLLSNAVSDFLGRISFDIYLLHAPVLWSLGGLTFLPLETRFGPLPAALTASLAVVAAACLAALVFHRLVERPAMRLAGHAGRLVATLGGAGRRLPAEEYRRKPA